MNDYCTRILIFITLNQLLYSLVYYLVKFQFHRHQNDIIIKKPKGSEKLKVI